MSDSTTGTPVPGSSASGVAGEFHEYADLVERDIPLSPGETAFGFLTKPWSFANEVFEVSPLDDYVARKRCFDLCVVTADMKKVLYPPKVVTWQSHHDGSWGPVPETSRPSTLFNPAPSHRFKLVETVDPAGKHSPIAVFTIQLLAFLSALRLQFHDWYLDTPIVLEPRNSSFTVFDKAIARLARRATLSVLQMNELERKVVTNAVYLAARSPHLFWNWERFSMDFMVLDAIRQHVKSSTSLKKKPTIEEVCDLFSIPHDAAPDPRIEMIRKFRNDLFHEALWAGETPGTSVSDEAWTAMLDLRGLVERFVCGLLGIGASFRASSWQSLSLAELKDD